jgi:hypothetical protein
MAEQDKIEAKAAPRRKRGILKKTLIVLLILIVGFVIVVALQPADFRVERSATIAAPASDVFAQVNDFHKWSAWSPWEKLDPGMQRTFEGPPSGAGATYAWKGNKEVGEGRMTITQSKPNELVQIRLEFIKPFAATNTTEFTFKPQGNQTVVNWAMFGQNNFMAKAFHLFCDMDKMVGKDFEKGLVQMKAAAEAKK